jgi:hypothetical protein
MPVGGMQMRERPDDARQRQTSRDLRVLIYIVAIIEIDELEVKGLAEDYPRYRDQKNADAEKRPAIARSNRLNDSGFSLTDLVL